MPEPSEGGPDARVTKGREDHCSVADSPGVVLALPGAASPWSTARHGFQQARKCPVNPFAGAKRETTPTRSTRIPDRSACFSTSAWGGRPHSKLQAGADGSVQLADRRRPLRIVGLAVLREHRLKMAYAKITRYRNGQTFLPVASSCDFAAERIGNVGRMRRMFVGA